MGNLFLAGLLAAGLIGCTKSDDAVVKKLDEISKKLDKLDDIEKKLAAGAIGRPGAARPQGPQPGRPDPSKVYSVAVDGAPSRGAKDAKVTIVEAFEFA
jgi:hypothetical protein